MYRKELSPYHSKLAKVLKHQPDGFNRQIFLAHERTTERYSRAKEQVTPRDYLLRKTIFQAEEVIGNELNEGRAEELAEAFSVSLINRSVEREKVVFWANEALNQYNNLPKKLTVGGHKEVNKLVRETAVKLLENPRDINIADEAWKRQKTKQMDIREPQEQFSSLIKKDLLKLIGEKWRDVTPDQLAQLIRILASKNDPCQEFAKEMFVNYCLGPSDKPERRYSRVVLYKNIVSATLDLLGEDEAFREGMKIALYATDILPKDPGLIEQVNLLSMPSKKEEDGDEFKNLLIIEYVTKQVIALSSQDFTEYIAANIRYVRTENKSLSIWHERKKIADVERGPVEAERRNKQIRAAMTIFLNVSRMPLFEDIMEDLRRIDPLYDKAFDENDHLIQKLKRVLSENRSRLVKVVKADPEKVASI